MDSPQSVSASPREKQTCSAPFPLRGCRGPAWFDSDLGAVAE